MIEHIKLASFFNMKLEAYHACGLFREIAQITQTMAEAMADDLVSTGKIEGPPYAPGKLVPLMLELLKPSPASRDERICTLRSSGMSYPNIAQQAGCSISTAKRHVRKSCLANLISLPVLRRAEVEAMNEAGWSRQEMVEQLGVSDRTVRRILKELGLDKRVI